MSVPMTGSRSGTRRLSRSPGRPARRRPGYRHRRCLSPEVAAVLLDAFDGGRLLADEAELAVDRLRVLPVLFHLMWQRQLDADLTVPLGMSAVVHASVTS